MYYAYKPSHSPTNDLNRITNWTSSSSSSALHLIKSLGLLQKFPPFFTVHTCCPPAPSKFSYPFPFAGPYIMSFPILSEATSWFHNNSFLLCRLLAIRQTPFQEDQDLISGFTPLGGLASPLQKSPPYPSLWTATLSGPGPLTCLAWVSLPGTETPASIALRDIAGHANLLTTIRWQSSSRTNLT